MRGFKAKRYGAVGCVTTCAKTHDLELQMLQKEKHCDKNPIEHFAVAALLIKHEIVEIKELYPYYLSLPAMLWS
ncbi:hypothetical protein BGX29_008698 [Mortierella sp. GBA35]|nr:hypothetical protein BGX29_008698 [Mortierella sp. GBA35]